MKLVMKKTNTDNSRKMSGKNNSQSQNMKNQNKKQRYKEEQQAVGNELLTEGQTCSNGDSSRQPDKFPTDQKVFNTITNDNNNLLSLKTDNLVQMQSANIINLGQINSKSNQDLFSATNPNQQLIQKIQQNDMKIKAMNLSNSPQKGNMLFVNAESSGQGVRPIINGGQFRKIGKLIKNNQQSNMVQSTNAIQPNIQSIEQLQQQQATQTQSHQNLKMQFQSSQNSLHSILNLDTNKQFNTIQQVQGLSNPVSIIPFQQQIKNSNKFIDKIKNDRAAVSSQSNIQLSRNIMNLRSISKNEKKEAIGTARKDQSSQQKIKRSDIVVSNQQKVDYQSVDKQQKNVLSYNLEKFQTFTSTNSAENIISQQANSFNNSQPIHSLKNITNSTQNIHIHQLMNNGSGDLNPKEIVNSARIDTIQNPTQVQMLKIGPKTIPRIVSGNPQRRLHQQKPQETNIQGHQSNSYGRLNSNTIPANNNRWRKNNYNQEKESSNVFMKTQVQLKNLSNSFQVGMSLRNANNVKKSQGQIPIVPIQETLMNSNTMNSSIVNSSRQQLPQQIGSNYNVTAKNQSQQYNTQLSHEQLPQNVVYHPHPLNRNIQMNQRNSNIHIMENQPSSRVMKDNPSRQNSKDSNQVKQMNNVISNKGSIKNLKPLKEKKASSANKNTLQTNMIIHNAIRASNSSSYGPNFNASQNQTTLHQDQTINSQMSNLNLQNLQKQSYGDNQISVQTSREKGDIAVPQTGGSRFNATANVANNINMVNNAYKLANAGLVSNRGVQQNLFLISNGQNDNSSKSTIGSGRRPIKIKKNNFLTQSQQKFQIEGQKLNQNQQNQQMVHLKNQMYLVKKQSNPKETINSTRNGSKIRNGSETMNRQQYLQSQYKSLQTMALSNENSNCYKATIEINNFSKIKSSMNTSEQDNKEIQLHELIAPQLQLNKSNELLQAQLNQQAQTVRNSNVRSNLRNTGLSQSNKITTVLANLTTNFKTQNAITNVQSQPQMIKLNKSKKNLETARKTRIKQIDEQQEQQTSTNDQEIVISPSHMEIIEQQSNGAPPQNINKVQPHTEKIKERKQTIQVEQQIDLNTIQPLQTVKNAVQLNSNQKNILTDNIKYSTLQNTIKNEGKGKFELQKDDSVKEISMFDQHLEDEICKQIQKDNQQIKDEVSKKEILEARKSLQTLKPIQRKTEVDKIQNQLLCQNSMVPSKNDSEQKEIMVNDTFSTMRITHKDDESSLMNNTSNEYQTNQQNDKIPIMKKGLPDLRTTIDTSSNRKQNTDSQNRAGFNTSIQPRGIVGTAFSLNSIESREKEVPPLPTTPQNILKYYINQLTEYEKGEILDYKTIYFLGKDKKIKVDGVKINSDEAKNNQSGVQDKTDKEGNSSKSSNQKTDQFTHNYGYDDDTGDYKIVMGDHVGYRYEIKEFLGKGSFGTALRCYDHKDKRDLAVKIVKNKKKYYYQASVELKILQYLRQYDVEDIMNVIHIEDYVVFRKHLCMSFELLSMNLFEFLRINDFNGFDHNLIRRFAIQLLYALKYLKQLDIIHCDLKPENILLKEENKSGIKIIDFGSSTFIDEKVYTYIQSRFYRAPEIMLGITYSTAIDMWSLGCIMAELYIGYPLFPGSSEIDQLCRIMEMKDVPPTEVLDRSERKMKFFKKNENNNKLEPIMLKNSRGKLRKPNGKPLDYVIGDEDPDFNDFVIKCLDWNPDTRITPDDALKHVWVLKGLPPQVLIHHQKMHNITTPELPDSVKVTRDEFIMLQKKEEEIQRQQKRLQQKKQDKQTRDISNNPNAPRPQIQLKTPKSASDNKNNGTIRKIN